MVKQHRLVMSAALATIVVALLSLRASRRARPAASPAPPIASSVDSGVPSVSRGRAANGVVAAGSPRMLHLDPRHTNRSPFEGPVEPVVAWTFDTGGPIEAAPALLPDGTILVASLGGKVFGLGEDGKARFSVDLGERLYSSPLVTDAGFFIGVDAGKFLGLTSGGVVRWKLETNGDADTAPALSPWGGLVFASGKMIYAAKPDGTLVWRVKTRRKSFSSPAVADDGTVYVGSQDHHLYAIDPSGGVRWRVDLGADVDSAPAIADDGTILAGSDRAEVVALAPADGAVRWRARVGGFVRGALSIGRDGVVLTGTYGPAPHVVALDPESGQTIWSFAVPGTGAPEFGVHGGPVEDAAGRLYFGAQDDCVYALSGEGKLLWKFKTQGDVDAPVVITPDGLLLAGSDDGKLYVFGRARRP
jgi:outer membrane protein assembly factor BamB